MIVSTPREKLWAFINTRVGVPWSEDFRAIGAVQGGCLAAVVAYNGWTGRSCFMHSAIDDPSVIDRTFVKTIFQYPFVQCKLTHLLALVDSANSKALDIDRRCGFKEVHRLEGAGLEGRDMILLQLRRDECRWIKGLRDGKEEPPASAGLHSSGAASSRLVQAEYH